MNYYMWKVEQEEFRKKAKVRIIHISGTTIYMHNVSLWEWIKIYFKSVRYF